MRRQVTDRRRTGETSIRVEVDGRRNALRTQQQTRDGREINQATSIDMCIAVRMWDDIGVYSDPSLFPLPWINVFPGRLISLFLT